MMCGSKMRHGFYQQQARNVAKKLKAHKTAKIVKDLRAIEVLGVHIFYMIKK